MADKKKIQVRNAQPKDVVNIAKLLKQGWYEQTVEYAPVEDLRGYKWIISVLEEGFVAVADLNGRIVGAAACSPFRCPWSLDWMLDVDFFYVMENFRREGVSDKLLKAVEGFADKVELSLTLNLQTGEKPLVKDRMMKIAGWKYVGGHHLRSAKKKDGRKENDDNEPVRES
jgi:GNAT superfamily N-acetyltransferase